ncbi:hypothetical protein [Phytomonospora endophytica]|uniref:Uncharacterized protein n=1 Tax=Phytomonospora endophytica TaxID=714109 RepID=A0A841FJK0_9ACTN|nr:hypothetical protein [Phytomonospora endophytica]MBB6037491.1 hypothetical protein [Phytomonospora endophytica]GIG70742.1 hypothetical protein Pen01_70370 [Phytomonospora endophytica]
MRRTFEVIAAAFLLVLSGCTGRPVPYPHTSYAAPSPTLDVVLEHDGYIATGAVCERIDWSVLTTLAPIDTPSWDGYWPDTGNRVANAWCRNEWGFPGESSPEHNSVVVELEIESSDRFEDSRCLEWDGPPVTGAGEEWDRSIVFHESTAGGQHPMWTCFTSGVFSVVVEFAFTETRWFSLGDAEARLAAIAVALAENARELSLSETYPDLPEPSAS